MEAIVIELIEHSQVTSKIGPSPIMFPHQKIEAKVDSERDLAETVNSTQTVDYNDLVSKLNEAVHNFGTKVTFSHDERNATPIIKVMDIRTGELIRQIPTEEALHLKAKLEEGLGLLFEESI